MNYTRLIISALILISGTVLVGLGKISGETWGAMLVGMLLPSPLEKKKKEGITKEGNLLLLPLFFLLLPSSAFAGILTDNVLITPLASPTCYAGRACIYAKNADNLLYTKDASGLELKLHAAQSVRISANCSGLASPALGDMCYDTSLNTFRFFSTAGWTSGAIDGAQYVTKTQTETVTGAKTFTANATFLGALVSGTIGPTTSYQHTLPSVASDTVALLAATQTLTNKTIAAPVLSGTVTGTYTIGGTATVQANTLTVGGAPAEAVFYRTCTLTSAAAAIPVTCLFDADVPMGKKAYLTNFTAKVNGGTAWSTVTSCTVEDTASNPYVTLPVSELASNVYLGLFSGSLTFDDRLTLGTGGTAAKGIRVKCDVNGTGSDLVFVLQGVVK